MIKFPSMEQCTNPNCNYAFRENEVQYQIKIYSANTPIYGGIICLKCYDNFKKKFLNQPKFCGHYEPEDGIIISISPPLNYLRWCLKCFEKTIKPEQIFLDWNNFSSLLEQQAKKIALKIALSRVPKSNKNAPGCFSYEQLIEIIIKEKGDFLASELQHSVKCEKCAELIAYLQAMFEVIQKIKIKQNYNRPCLNFSEILALIMQCFPYLTKHENKIKKKEPRTLKHLKECRDCKEFVERIIDEISKIKYFFRNC